MEEPKGRACRLCPYVLVLGGFAETHQTLDVLAQNMNNEQKFPSLASEFVACQDRLVKSAVLDALPEREKFEGPQ